MERRGILCALFFILSMGEFSSRFRMMWLPNLSVVDVGTYFTWPILSASVFVLVAFLLSMYLIFEHPASYNQHEFLSLVNSEATFNCEVIRDCYEAFALYCFERYMIACLDLNRVNFQLFMASKSNETDRDFYDDLSDQISDEPEKLDEL